MSGPDGEDLTRSGGLRPKEPRVRRPRQDHFPEAGPTPAPTHPPGLTSRAGTATTGHDAWPRQ
jgi:hypothetical protein